MQKNSSLFDKYSNIYDLIYEKKKYKREVNYICKLLKKHKKNNKNILEFGSGTGKHAKFFIDKGYKICGIEKSKKMILSCGQLKNAKFYHGDICNFKLKKKFEIIMSLFHVLSYQTSKKKINDFFSNAKYHLNKGGLFGFDFWYTPSVNFQKPQIRYLEKKSKNKKVIKISNPINCQKKIIDIKYLFIIKNFLSSKINFFTETHSMRHFSLNEINKISKKHSFKIVHTSELVTNNKPSKNTWAIFCLLKKI